MRLAKGELHSSWSDSDMAVAFFLVLIMTGVVYAYVCICTLVLEWASM